MPECVETIRCKNPKLDVNGVDFVVADMRRSNRKQEQSRSPLPVRFRAAVMYRRNLFYHRIVICEDYMGSPWRGKERKIGRASCSSLREIVVVQVFFFFHCGPCCRRALRVYVQFLCRQIRYFRPVEGFVGLASADSFQPARFVRTCVCMQ